MEGSAAFIGAIVACAWVLRAVGVVEAFSVGVLYYYAFAW
jgi:hypothetical protein